MDDTLRTKLEQPTIEEHESRSFVGIRVAYPATMEQNRVFAKLAEQYDTAIGRMHEIEGRRDQSWIALSTDMFSGTTDSGFTYFFGAEVTGEDRVPEGMERITLPGQRYLVFPHPLPEDAVRGSLYTIWHEWLPANDYSVPKDGPDSPDYVEWYSSDYDKERGTGTITLSIPIRP